MKRYRLEPAWHYRRGNGGGRYPLHDPRTKERLDPSEYANVKAQFVLRASDLNGARANMKVLHPLPRIDEITTDVDKTPHAWYFQQAGNGIFARQALLALVLNSELAL